MAEDRAAVLSHAQPDANITGLASIAPEVVGKQLELLTIPPSLLGQADQVIQ